MGHSPRRQAKTLMFAESRAGDGSEGGRRVGEGRRRQPGREGGREAGCRLPRRPGQLGAGWAEGFARRESSCKEAAGDRRRRGLAAAEAEGGCGQAEGRCSSADTHTGVRWPARLQRATCSEMLMGMAALGRTGLPGLGGGQG